MKRSKEKKDIVEKEFVSFPDVTADVINALLYRGKRVTEAENLLAGPTETVYQGREKLRSQYEDLCKYELVNGRVNTMYLIANQSKTDGKTLLRKAGYTGAVYREQYERKTRDIFPVVEFVLYWGKSRWKSSRNVRRLFRKRKLSGEIWEYIDELKLHVFEMRYLPEETRKLFQSDMRIVVDFLAEGDGYRSDRKIVHKAALIRMIKVLSGEEVTEDIEKWLEEQGIGEEDEVTVCELFDQYVRQGRREGRAEGIAEGIAEGRVEGIAEGRAKGIVEGRVKGIAEGREEGIVVGRMEGEKKGIEKGESRFAKLVQSLLDNGRSEELKKAAFDQKYRERLYMEVGLI